ncbi:hypothetical protein F4818DRAFT_427335 [Hypoxylon cercidicola]|nr:hypothetical protein F4818DRAFT_427335 [Hypoxylon cercidicola]
MTTARTDVYDFLPQEGFTWLKEGTRGISKKEGRAIGRAMIRTSRSPLTKSVCKTMITELFDVGLEYFKQCEAINVDDDTLDSYQTTRSHPFWDFVSPRVRWLGSLSGDQMWNFLMLVVHARCEFTGWDLPLQETWPLEDSGNILHNSVNFFWNEFEEKCTEWRWDYTSRLTPCCISFATLSLFLQPVEENVEGPKPVPRKRSRSRSRSPLRDITSSFRLRSRSPSPVGDITSSLRSLRVREER